MAGSEISDKKGSKLNILQTLRKHGNVSRIDLTRLTGLSRATVSVSIAELIESKLVRETTDRMATKGRPATYLELVPYAGTIIGADYDNSRWTLCAFDLSGNIIKKASIPAASSSAEDVLHSLLIQLKPFIGSLEATPYSDSWSRCTWVGRFRLPNHSECAGARMVSYRCRRHPPEGARLDLRDDKSSPRPRVSGMPLRLRTRLPSSNLFGSRFRDCGRDLH